MAVDEALEAERDAIVAALGPVADPAVEAVEEEHTGHPADEVRAQPEARGRRGQPELRAEGGDRRAVQRLQDADEHEADAGGDHGGGAEDPWVRGCRRHCHGAGCYR